MSLGKKLINFLSDFTDGTRSGGERCPYCGNLHFLQSEMDACARAYSSPSSGPYYCNRCGRPHTTLEGANHCCENEKRYESQYDPEKYNGYTYGSSGYGSGSAYGYGSGPQTAEEEPYDSGGGILDAFLNAGSSNSQSSSSSNSGGGGIFDSFLNAGGGNKDNNSGGSSGGFWPWE